jgi:hypothetical protein
MAKEEQAMSVQGLDHVTIVTDQLHHVAFKAQGFADTLARVQAMAAPHRINDLQHAGLRQIMLCDPNNINIELNFVGE